jgi:uncharacterized membrane protein
VKTIWTLVAVAALAGCGGAPETTAPSCADTAVLTWDNFGQAFIVTNCQSCHATTAADRHGAPADVVFDTRGDVLRQAARVLARVTGDPPTMPPGGGISEESRHKITVWLSCFETEALQEAPAIFAVSDYTESR